MAENLYFCAVFMKIMAKFHPLIRFFSLALLLFIFKSAAAQKFTISGYLRDSISGESLLGATVFDLQSKTGTAANAYGFYSLTLPKGEHQLRFSFVGYKTEERTIDLQKDISLDVAFASAAELKEVEITAARSERIQDRTQMSAISLPVLQLKSLPAFLGEVDILKSLQLMPGIQSGGEGSSGIYVRGGGADQNLMLLDGVPVYNVSHLFGFFSVFNADAINNVEIIKGGFPARYGGRISSVLDINLKEGNSQNYQFEGSVGIVAAKITAQGPIIKDKTSFIVSARRTYIDALTEPIFRISNAGQNDKYILNYHFYDLTAKINHVFSPKDRIFLSAYLGKDKFSAKSSLVQPEMGSMYDGESKAGLDWGNITTAFRWNHVITNKLFMNTSLTFSQYKFDISTSSRSKMTQISNDSLLYETKFSSNYFSSIYDFGAKVHFDFLPNPNHTIKFGSSAIYHTFRPGVVSMLSEETDFSMGADKIGSWDYNVFFEDDIRFGSRLKANLGVHASFLNVRDAFYYHIQPRASLRYLITPDFSIKAGYSRMAQYIHLLTNSSVGLPTDLWVPATQNIKPQTSDQLALGLAYNLFDAYEFSLEGYYKTTDNVLEYKEGASFISSVANQWEDKVTQGIGKAYGLEFFIQKKEGAFSGWLAYTLAWSLRKFDDLNNGKWFNYRYGRRHDFAIAGIYTFNKKVELSATWVFGTGNWLTVPHAVMFLHNPITGPIELVPGWLPEYRDYGERNDYQMMPTHRLDIAVTITKPKKWGIAKWTFGAYNAYSHKNPFYVDLSREYDGKYVFKQYSIFPIIPAISYSFKFQLPTKKQE